MSFNLLSDPGYGLRKIEKLFLAFRFFFRFPRRYGAWPKYEYLKPWIVDQTPSTVVDVGVNLGQFLHMAYRLWPNSRIVGIEPSADLARQISTIYEKQSRVQVECCAASDREGDATFFVTKNNQNSSLLQPSSEFVEDRPGDGLLRTEDVQLKRLDTLLGELPGPLFVKIDVQGAELEVIKGMGKRLDDVETLIVEAPFEEAYEGASEFDEIYRYLSDRGLAYAGPLGILTSKRTGRVRQEDAVFVRKDPARFIDEGKDL